MARTTVAPQWLKSTHVSGLDQLGVQVISIALYGDLLPGITNVTDRIRYYSFYPWLLHRYASDVQVLDETTWQNYLRRAEFLLALVGRFHHREDSEGGEAIVGADQATKALVEIQAKPGKVWRLSRWAAVGNAGQKGSYFKNKNGGFGQYYRGQLASLGLINFARDSLGIKLAKGKGTEIARICDSQKGRADFWRSVMDDKFTLEKIAAWGDCLCPCAVGHYDEECEFLVKLLFGPDELSSETSFSRARTLRLLLAMLNQASDLAEPVTHFRNLAYYEHDEKAKRFRPPANLVDVFQKWSIYETCEFVNYTLEVAFDAILHHLTEFDIADTGASRFISITSEAALRVSSSTLGLGTGKSDWCNRTLGDIIEESRIRQQPLADWRDDPWSESNLIFGLNDQPPLIRLARSFACLVAIHARNRMPSQPFQAFSSITADWLDRHKVTLATVYKFLSERADRNAATVFAEFLKDYVVGQHLRVAMRKLRYQSQSTFKLAVEDGRFIWLEHFEPTRTNPRLRQAFRFLRDLGFCSGHSGGWRTSHKGKEQLRHEDGN
jgi:hypothetical protein